MFKGDDGRVCDARSLQSRDGLLPGFVCRLGCLLNTQPRRCLLIAVECAEMAVSMTSERRVSRSSRRRLAQTASRIMPWMSGLAAMRTPKCARAAMSRPLVYPIRTGLRRGLLASRCPL